jgi:hypothetical protein
VRAVGVRTVSLTSDAAEVGDIVDFARAMYDDSARLEPPASLRALVRGEMQPRTESESAATTMTTSK